MIRVKVVWRLAVTAAAGALLLLALAYWWLSNLVHEAAGTLVFALVARHIYVNRFWFVNLAQGTYDTRRRIVAIMHCLIVVNMVLLLGTSLAISQSVFAFLPIPDNVTVRDLHWVSAYWLVIIVGVHLGLHWSRMMALLRSALQVTGTSAVRTAVLRLLAAGVVLFGLWSFVVLGVQTKLTWNYSLDFWDFSSSVHPFFAHWASVMALPAVLTHYGLQLLPPKGKSASGPRAAAKPHSA